MTDFELKYKNALEAYGKAYKEAIKKIKSKIFDNGAIVLDRKDLEEIFPELAESEDERISKEIIKYLEQTVPHHHRDEVLKSKEWIVWLENQRKIVDYNEDRLDECACKYFNKGYKQALEKHSEQKLTDKVKPKFHEGDWIVFNGLILHIDEIVDGYYRTTSIGGIPNSYDWNIDNAARLWAIQDAKKGEVLAEDSCVFILKEMANDFHAAITYCTLFDDGDFHDGETLYFDIDSTRPATKEQRDLLFQKMKEEGYEWDTEKKELRKIENPTAWSEEDREILDDIIVDVEVLKEQDRTKDGKVAYQKKITWLKSLKDRYTWKPSDKQIDVLLSEVTSWTKGCPKQIVLESLYNDLKKLKENIII